MDPYSLMPEPEQEKNLRWDQAMAHMNLFMSEQEATNVIKFLKDFGYSENNQLSEKELDKAVDQLQTLQHSLESWKRQWNPFRSNASHQMLALHETLLQKNSSYRRFVASVK